MAEENIVKEVQSVVADNPVAVFGKSYCPHTKRVRILFDELKARYEEVDLDEVDNGDMMQIALTMVTSQPTVPYVFIKGNFIGGADETLALAATEKMLPLLRDAHAID